MDSLAFKPNLNDILARLDALYDRKASDRVFALFDILEYLRRRAGW